MLAVYALEIRRLCRGPTLWIIAALLQLVLAWYCLGALEQYLVLQNKFSLQDNGPGLSTWLLARYSYPSAFALLLSVPALSMQSVAAERREGSLTLLMVAPVSDTAITAGKFFALTSVLGGFVLLALTNLLALSMLAPLDMSAIAVAHLSLFALVMSAAALGMLCSSLSASPVASAFACSSVLLVMWLMGGSRATVFADFSVESLSLPSHLGRGLQGVLHSGDMVYFLAITLTALAFVTRHMSTLRQQGGN